MKRNTVKSANIKSIGYDNENTTLEIEFISNSLYHYQDISQTIYNSLLHSISKGKYFNQYIKGKFEYTKVS